MESLKKVTVYYTEHNERFQAPKSRRRTIWVPGKMADTWDWSGIEKTFCATRRGDWYSDSAIKVTKIRIGRAILQG